MSTFAGRRTTRSASRAASSRAASETPSVGDEGPANLRSSKAGSAKPKRSNVGNKNTKTYGSKIAAAGAERLANATGDGAAGGIEAALNQTQGPVEEPTSQAHEEHLAAVQEESSEHTSRLSSGIASRVRVRLMERAAGQGRSHIDPFEEEAHRSNGNQPLEGFSVLQKQITLSNSDISIDRTLASLFQPKHYFALAAFIMVLILFFADIYRGPLLGSRFDLHKSRFSVGNHTVIPPIDVSNIEHRLSALEFQLRNQAKESQVTGYPWQVNFFSHRYQLVVNPYLTSPTKSKMEPCQTWYERWFHPRLCPVSFTGSGPAEVFTPWNEDTGPAWCAPDGEAKLQIGAIVAGPMTPTELIVEHMPQGAVLLPNRTPAPKEMELWMQVSDDALRESIGREAESLYGSFDRHLNPKSIGDDFVPIGRWIYDAHAPNHIQPFKVLVNLKGAHTNTLVVRANSNWAEASYTCLYRLRLHGISHLADKDIEVA